MSSFTPTTKDAAELLIRGTLALAQVEEAGIAVDVDYLDRTIRRTESKLRDLEDVLRGDEIYRLWRREYGTAAKLGSRDQLSHVLFNVMGVKPSVRTEGLDENFDDTNYYDEEENSRHHRQSTNKAALAGIDLPFLKDYEEFSNHRTLLGTFLQGLRRETVDGFVHPEIALNLVKTGRSCVAKGTMIETVRDVADRPGGIPIEEVKVGDYVYCYDSNLKLTLRKVLWSGKTGTRRVIRLHWKARGTGRSGHLDVTPEHKVRLVSGRYVPAESLMDVDVRKEMDCSKHCAKVRVLAMSRDGDRIWETGGGEILDHRFVYENLIGPIEPGYVVHHKDGNHLNNFPDNLEKKTPSEHAYLHAPEVFTPVSREKGRRTRMELHEASGDKWRRGSEHFAWKGVGRFGLLRLLSACGGRPTMVVGYDFGLISSRLEQYGMSYKNIRNRYDKSGNYISLGRFKKIFDGTIRSVVRGLGVDYYRARRLLEERGMTFEYLRESRNPWGRNGKPNNHVIVKVEWIDKVVDVYDLEVEECHNFIANEICVHNSAKNPNIMNQWNRNQKMAALLRRCYVPRDDDWVLAEVDFGAVEVRGICCYTRDQELLRRLEDPHRDWACELFFLEPKLVDKKTHRDWAKNRFVFPKFYGSSYRKIAPHLWMEASKEIHKAPGAEGKTLREYLEERGVKALGDPEDRDPPPGTFVYHVRRVENKFDDLFNTSRRWRYDWVEEYRKKGYFDHLTGYRQEGLYSRNAVINHPIQGTCFHWLLWSLIQIQKEFRRRGLKALIVSEIHDCLLIDCPRAEIQDVLNICKRVMTEDVRKHWPWIITPLIVEADVTETRRDGGNWAAKKPWVLKDGLWLPKEKAA